MTMKARRFTSFQTFAQACTLNLSSAVAEVSICAPESRHVRWICLTSLRTRTCFIVKGSDASFWAVLLRRSLTCSSMSARTSTHAGGRDVFRHRGRSLKGGVIVGLTLFQTMLDKGIYSLFTFMVNKIPCVRGEVVYPHCVVFRAAVYSFFFSN